MSFTLTADQNAHREEMVAFAQEELGADLRERDRTETFARADWERCAAKGILGSHVPTAFGGQGLDALRTVGWFTALYPLRLALPAGLDGGACLDAVKSRLRDISDGGIAYGALRYLGAPGDDRGALKARPPSPVLFNYLGQWRSSPSRRRWC